MSNSKISFTGVLKASLLGFLLIAVVHQSNAQEILNSHGEKIPQNPNATFELNEIIVNFRPGSIALPQGLTEAILEKATVHNEIVGLLQSAGVGKLKKVFRFFTPADTIKTLRTGERVQVQDLSQVFLLKFSAPIDVPGMVERFKKSPRVIHAQPNYSYHTEDNPSDPGFPRQWGLKQASNEDINAPAAWSIQTGSYNIKLGIFDTGIDYGHDDLGNAFGIGWKVVGGWDWVNNDADPRDDYFHGTHVAGIAGALTNNTNSGQSVGVAGVAGGWGYERSTNTGNKGVQLFAMKVLDGSGNGSTATAARAIVEGADPDGDGWGYGINILNNSWGGYGYDETLRSAVNYAARFNRVFLAAKGNDNSSAYHFPSDYDPEWVISVGATNRSGQRAQYPDYGWSYGHGSNYGNGIDVVAPGTAIYSTMPTYVTSGMTDYGIHASYDSISGTSMATPHVAGLAALIFSQNSTPHSEDVQGIIRASADDINSSTYPGYDNFMGAGRINAGRALQYMQSPWTLDHYTAYGGAAVINTDYYNAIFYNTGSLPTDAYIVKRYDVRKTVSYARSFSGTPYVWGRGVNATVGWSASNPNYETGFCNVTSSTATSAELQTYTYEVWNIWGQYLGWYPSRPENLTFAYTVLGIPQPLSVSISGPDWVMSKHYYTYTANVSGGSGNVNYQWYKDGQALGTAQQQSVYSGMSSYTVSVNVHDNGTAENASASMDVWNDGDGGIASPQTQDRISKPTEFSIGQNYPNPFNPETQIAFGLPEPSEVTITISDLLGREIVRLASSKYSANYHSVRWAGADASGNKVGSGIYFYRINVVGESGKRFTKVMKMSLMK